MRVSIEALGRSVQRSRVALLHPTGGWLDGQYRFDEQGRLQGANASLMGLSGLIAPWAFAMAFAFAIDPAKGLNVPGLPFYAAALLLAIGVVVAAGLRGTVKQEASEAV